MFTGRTDSIPQDGLSGEAAGGRLGAVRQYNTHTLMSKALTNGRWSRISCSLSPASLVLVFLFFPSIAIYLSLPPSISQQQTQNGRKEEEEKNSHIHKELLYNIVYLRMKMSTEVRCTCRYPAETCRSGACRATGNRRSSCGPRNPGGRARTIRGKDKSDDPGTRDCIIPIYRNDVFIIIELCCTVSKSSYT